MNFALVSLHTENYNRLANLTWKNNKEIYSKRHGYNYICKTKNFYGVTIGYEKIWFLRDLLSNHSNIEWFWWTGCDSMVTNMTVDLSSRVDNNYHFIISSDCNGINADSFFVRNSYEGNKYIDMIISLYEKYKFTSEQQAIEDTYHSAQSIVKLVPQKSINSYNYDLYPYEIYKYEPFDKLGFNGNWSLGDLLIHWPGTNLDHRCHLAEFYSTQVIK